MESLSLERTPGSFYGSLQQHINSCIHIYFCIHIYIEMPHYQYNVKMACSGCSNAVTRALSKMDGVQKVDANLEKQTVDVIVSEPVSYESVLERIAKTGKQVLGGKTL